MIQVSPKKIEAYSNIKYFLEFDNILLFEFPNLNNFLVFNNFSYFSINLLLSLISPILLVDNISLAISIYNDIVVFSIDISYMAILLKFLINC